MTRSSAARRQTDDEVIEAGRAAARAVESLDDAARNDPAVFCAYVLRDEQTGRPIRLAPMHVEWQDTLTTHPRVVIWTHTEAGKAVPLDTPIPTPGGWRTMGDLAVGDLVFGSDGKPCRVRAVSAVQHERALYRVRFDDGDSVLADADHQWIAWSHDDLVAKREPRVVTTAKMMERLTRAGGGRKPNGEKETRYRWKIPLAAPVSYREAELPIPPYLLGAWLGDGDSVGPTLTFHEDDRFILDRCLELSGARTRIHRDPRRPAVCRAYLRISERGVRGEDTIVGRLRHLGVLGDKHIPEVYLRASEEQRRELLAGLLDTDGAVGRRGRVEFCSMSKRLATDVLELVRSLGIKARLAGRVVGTRFRVTFTPGCAVFRLPRKLAGQVLERRPGRAGHRSVVAIEPEPSVPVRCIAVDSPDSSYLMSRSYTVTHNTSAISVGRTLWEIGKNPGIRILILSNASGGPKKIVKAIKSYIERSREYRRIFPNVRPDKSESGSWREDSFHVVRPNISKDPTVQAAGFEGDILGGRYDLIIIDDYLNAPNTHSDVLREKYHSWLKSTIESRRARGGRLWFIGNAWHEDDSMHRYAKEAATYAKKYPVRNELGESSWPEVWTQERIDEEIANRGPIEAPRSLFCSPVDDAERRFKSDYVRRALELGNGRELMYRLSFVPAGYRTITGVDLASSKKKKSDRTALVTIAVEERTRRRHLLDITCGKMSGPEIVDTIKEIHSRYHSLVVVESNAAQAYIKQFLDEGSAVPVRAFYTGKNKIDPTFGLESIAVELSQGKWVFPNDGGTLEGRIDPEVLALIGEMFRYEPRTHPGDRLMAMWIAREGARLAAGIQQGKRPRRT